MYAQKRIKRLVNVFHENLTDYKKEWYNEIQLRYEFIEPFFTELGWDMSNEQGLEKGCKGVLHDDIIEVDGAPRVIDYSFRIGQVRKFILKAGKDIKEDSHSAYQLRQMGLSIGLPLNILTDFEHFAVYDCRSKPTIADEAKDSRILFLKYTDYQSRWNEIHALFSKKSMLQGFSFDRYIASNQV
ncbi:MAG: hypothetical protein ABIK15_14895 [Pseudomonadota bacterium]